MPRLSSLPRFFTTLGNHMGNSKNQKWEEKNKDEKILFLLRKGNKVTFNKG